MSNKPIHLKPFVSAGEVFRLPGSSELHIVPMQLFRGKTGTILRIGEMTYWFDETGTYTGPEMSTRGLLIDETKLKEITQLLADCEEENRGKPPALPYFAPGTPGHSHEIAGWPKPPTAN